MKVRILQSIAICGLLAVGVLTAWTLAPEIKQRETGPRETESPDPQHERAIRLVNWRHKEVCPAGHETELIMGQMRVFVDLQAVGHLQIEDSQEVPEGCPAAAIYTRSVTFDHIWRSKAQEALFQRYNLPLNHLDLVRAPAGYYVGPEIIAENPGGRITVDGLGSIEDITRQHNLPNANSRAYRLQLAAAMDPAPAVIFMLCHERGDERACETMYRYGDLRVAYQFDQDKSNPPNELLAVDARVRRWIEDMLHHQGGT